MIYGTSVRKSPFGDEPRHSWKMLLNLLGRLVHRFFFCVIFLRLRYLFAYSQSLSLEFCLHLIFVFVQISFFVEKTLYLYTKHIVVMVVVGCCRGLFSIFILFYYILCCTFHFCCFSGWFWICKKYDGWILFSIFGDFVDLWSARWHGTAAFIEFFVLFHVTVYSLLIGKAGWLFLELSQQMVVMWFAATGFWE